MSCPPVWRYSRHRRQTGFSISILKVNEQFYTYTFMTLIANLGGYVGLFTGASIFSMLEGGIQMMMKFDKLKAMLT